MTYGHQQKDSVTGEWIYVAPNGVKFEIESDFEVYCTDIYDSLVDKIEKIPHVETTSEDLHMYHPDDEETVWILIPRTKQDISILCKIQKWADRFGDRISEDHIGKPLAVRFGFNWDELEIVDLEVFRDELARNIDCAIGSIKNYDKTKRSESNG